VLVTGLLLIGLVAAEEGLFEVAGAAVERLPGPPIRLLAACLGLVFAVTAVLNLDTAVVFLTHRAGQQGRSPSHVRNRSGGAAAA
jgi:arsenical pump membrane protein